MKSNGLVDTVHCMFKHYIQTKNIIGSFIMRRTISFCLSILLLISVLSTSAFAVNSDSCTSYRYLTYDVSGSGVKNFIVNGNTVQFTVSVEGKVSENAGGSLTYSHRSLTYSVTNIPSGYTANAYYLSYYVSGGNVYARVRCELTGANNYYGNLIIQLT